MATEEYKQVMRELFNNYIELRKLFVQNKTENIQLSYKDYIEFYLKYNSHFDEVDEDEED